MIEGRNINKRFDELILFNNFNFMIDDADFVCFSGASGKGKTTLLNIIGLLEPIDSGQLLIDGTTYINNRKKLEYYRNKVGFLFQNFALIENKSVKENLEIIRKNNRTEYSIRDVLEKVGLLEKINNEIYTLSGGEQQRIALARLFLKKCEIILADEPTGSLDAENAKIIMSILQELNDEGKTIVLVTHDEKVKSMARKVIEL